MSFPEESRHTPATAHGVEPATKAASTLSLRAPFSGGVQIAGTRVLRKRARETARLGQRRKRCSVVSGHFLHTGHNGSGKILRLNKFSFVGKAFWQSCHRNSLILGRVFIFHTLDHRARGIWYEDEAC
ncbi:uncharacterized protein LOC115670560 isoform X2 [Syzygium oleosum]|uniref:uncharacterized protein LOC115670560 isoform X2 n=1 Tax=Syzygium oleosum TaxID=219896 RepID=UPI0024BA12B6|nr:uncharacterized protein LOC115670560 isoform X2 [Syzygium oleosum]